MSERQLLGQTLDNLGLKWDFDEGDIITDVVLIAKVTTTNASQQTKLLIEVSEGTDFITLYGLLTCATQLQGNGDWNPIDDDTTG